MIEDSIGIMDVVVRVRECMKTLVHVVIFEMYSSVSVLHPLKMV